MSRPQKIHHLSVDVYGRQPVGSWMRTDYDPDDVIELVSVDLQVPLAVAYQGIDLPPSAVP